MLSSVQTQGTEVIKSEQQVDLLINGLNKAGEHTYRLVCDAIEKDTQLCKAIAKRTYDVAEKIIESNNEHTTKVLDTYQANSDAIRHLLLNPDGSDVSVSACLDELREYARLMQEAASKNRETNETVSRRAKETDEIVMSRSKSNMDKIIKIGRGITLAGILSVIIKDVVLPLWLKDKR